MSNALSTRSIDGKIKTFAKLKKKRTQVAQLKKELDEQYNDLRNDLCKVMKDKKVLTLKTEDYTLSRHTRHSLTIVDHEKLIKAYTKWGLKAPVKVDYFAALSHLNARKKAGRTVPGTEEKELEFVTIRINKPAKKKGGDK